MSAKKSARTGLWLLTTLAFFLLAFMLGVWAINRALVGSSPAVRNGTVLSVRLQGGVGEIAQRGPFLGPLTVREIDEAIRRAADDDRVAALFLDVGPVLGGYAKAQEIRTAVEHFKERGKPVVSLLENASNLDLYLATAADTVYQIPSGQLVLGLLVQEPFYRDLLDSIGVTFEVFTSGAYKTAFHSFTNRELTDAQREMDESLLDSLYQQWLEGVGADRDIGAEELDAIFDRGMLTARQAQAAGLIDELGYRDDIQDTLQSLAGRTPRRVDVREYLRATGPSSLQTVFAQGNVVALIHISGLMVPGDFEDGLFGVDVAAGTTIARYIREARQDRSVKAIVLRIDSGGGAVTAADVMGREIELAAERKPVIVSMSDVAASGGYWIAAKATRVVANPATYTGSIGVVMGRLDLRGTYEWLGVNHEIIKRGDNADLLTDASALRPEQMELLQRNVDATYADFIDVVAKGRGMEPDAVDGIAQGRVWTGQQALENGLVDELGGLRQAMVAARAAAGIGPQESISVRVYPPTRTFFEEISRLFTSVATATTGIRLPEVALPSATAVAWERFRRLQAAGPGWALLDAALPTPAR